MKRAILAQHNIEWDQIFVQILVQRLLNSLRERWICKLSPLFKQDMLPTSKDMINFLSAELATMKAMTTNSSTMSMDKIKTNSKTTN